MKLILKDKTELQVESAVSMNEIVLAPVSLEELNSIIPKITPENISYIEFYNGVDFIGCSCCAGSVVGSASSTREKARHRTS